MTEQSDELEILDDPEEDEVYVRYDIATYPSQILRLAEFVTSGIRGTL